MPDDHPTLNGGHWWACEQPERPPEVGTEFWHRCAACRLSFAVWARMSPWVWLGDENPLSLAPGRHDALQVAVMLAEHYHDDAMARVVA